MAKKDVVAMLLAGGKGTRLGIMTHNLAKPAIPFGAEYRLVDFPLSNCANSGIDTVGVLTQYEPLELNSYIGNGSSWDLDRRDGGVTVLPPYITSGGANWYKGTADAIYQNIKYIENYDPEYVLILSGDHIYKMDYRKMIEFHKEKKADTTIAVIKVPWEEAHRFGIMNTDENDKIIEFQEKPDNPKSNLASMGIYIFNWNKLRTYLIDDHNESQSNGDFGKDIIPSMKDDNLDIYAYEFNGYWRDVGTLESYWQTHMDLLKEDSKLNLYDRDWIISSVNPCQPPFMVSNGANVSKTLVNKGAQIFGDVKNSVIFFGSIIGENTTIKDSIILSDVKIKKGCYINKAIICKDATIEDNCKIGTGHNNSELTVIGAEETITKGSFIKSGTVVGK